jgi:hypothetical protein
MLSLFGNIVPCIIAPALPREADKFPTVNFLSVIKNAVGGRGEAKRSEACPGIVGKAQGPGQAFGFAQGTQRK